MCRMTAYCGRPIISLSLPLKSHENWSSSEPQINFLTDCVARYSKIGVDGYEGGNAHVWKMVRVTLK